MRLALNVASALAYIFSAAFWLYAYWPAPSLPAWFAMREHAAWELDSVKANQRAALAAGAAALLQAVASVVR